jgi:LuxR family maltose regulon positive regulatory protein
MELISPVALDWFVQTKFYPPALRNDLLPRPRLITALAAAAAATPLTLVSAPAGYGKTTLVTAWLAMDPAPARAWLGLDEDDNDLGRFLAALIAATGRLQPGCGARAATLLAAQPNPGAQARRILGLLINDLLESLPGPAILVLDDLHVLTEPALYAALDYFIEHLPPDLHLVVTTRHDPPLALARMRARGQIAELRLAALRFTDAEAVAFLQQQLGRALSAPEGATVQAHIEGWPAGLRLLAGSLGLAAPDDRAALVDALGHTEGLIFDFLAEEVLRRQDPAIQRFLIETAILPELTPTLCQAVTGRADSAAILEDLLRRSLFVTTRTGAGGAYQYHALFAAFLQRQLEHEPPEQVAALHRRAGAAETNPSRAIEHYLAARAWPEAAALIAQGGEDLLRQGWLDTVRRWIGALPAALREERPRLLYLLGLAAWQQHLLPTAIPLLEQAARGFAAAGDAAGEGAALAHLAAYKFLRGDLNIGRQLVEQCLERPLPPPLRAQLLVDHARVALAQNEWPRAVADVDAALRLGEESDRLDVLSALLTHYTVLLSMLPGGLAQQERLCQIAEARLPAHPTPLHVTLGAHQMSVHLAHGRLHEAIAVAESALTLAGRWGGGDPQTNITLRASLARVYGTLGQYARAHEHYAQVFREIAQMGLREILFAGVLYGWGLLYWMENRLSEAEAIYTRLCAAELPAELPALRPLRLLLRGLLDLAAECYAEAEAAFREAARLEIPPSASRLYASAPLCLAYLYYVQQRPQDALAEFVPLLVECEREDRPGLILRDGLLAVPLLRLAVAQGTPAGYAVHLLDLLGAERQADRPAADKERDAAALPGGERLSAREVEVLRHLAGGASNREIAARLIITEQTVKTHLVHIFRKLDVTSRTQASARARDLGLL